MRASTFWFAALLVSALSACEDEPQLMLDGASAIVVPDAAQAATDAGVILDAAPPGPDAALATLDAAADALVDAASSQPVRDAAGDAQPPADAAPKSCPGGARLAPGATAVELMVGGQP